MTKLKSFNIISSQNKIKGVLKMEIVKEMSNSDYRAREGLSSSDIKMLLENPYKYKIGYKKPKSENLALGSAVHSLILEPENFKRDFLVMPDLNLRTKEGKEEKAKLEYEAESSGKILIKEDSYKKALDIVDNFKQRSVFDMFKNGVSEVSFFSEINGIKCKARPDYFIQDKGIILDLKTTSQENGASPDNFLKAIANFRYYIQAKWYMLLTGAKEFYFVVLETESPYMLGVYELDKVSLDFAEKEILRAFEIFRNLDKFQSIFLDNLDYSKVQTLTLPNYVYYQKGAEF